MKLLNISDCMGSVMMYINIGMLQSTKFEGRSLIDYFKNRTLNLLVKKTIVTYIL